MTPTPQTRHLFRRTGTASLRALALAGAAAFTATAMAQGATPAPPPGSNPAAHTSAPASATTTPASLQALPTLDVPPYMGTWYQVAWFPNRFQKQCVSDTSATYRQQPDGRIEVLNRCRKADGSFDEALGQARPVGTLTGTRLAPAQLQVSFLPGWLRWLPVGWGRYWVIQLADDGRYAVISEPTREYLWVLARRPELAPADETAIRSALARQGFGDLSAWQPHTHTAR
jgi:apolipoprotein D and lipocalin family protein